MPSRVVEPGTLLVGAGHSITSTSEADWKAQLAKVPAGMATRLAFMTPEHHLVRDFAVRELPRENGRAIPVERLAATLGLPLPRVREIVAELERNLFFLVRNGGGEISWAFPVTRDRTPHRLRFSTGERTYGA